MDLKVVFILVILLFSIGTAYAAEGPSPEEAGAGMVKKGLDMLIMSLAEALNYIWQDNMFSEEFEKNQNITDEKGATQSAILTFVSVNPNPQNIEPLENFKNNTKYVWILIVAGFIFLNPVFNTYTRTFPETYKSAFGDRYISDEKFIGTTFLLIISYFAPYAVLMVLDLSTEASKWLMLNILDYIEPSLDNAWMYLFMAIGELLLAAFFIIRPWVICIVYAASILLSVWYFLGIWREKAEWVWEKFFAITTLQPVCVFVACVCLIGIKWIGWEDGAGGYILMFVFLAYICYKYMFGNFGLRTLTETSKVAIMRKL